MTQVSFPAKFQPFFRPCRYKVAKGGRGSAKSHSIARALVLRASTEPLRICCAREYQKSIEESVLQLLGDVIDEMGLAKQFEVQKTAIYGVNGSVFKFVGVKTNPQAFKSFEGIDILWMEEAEKVSKRSWSIVIPTVRKAGSEIWISYNPDEEDDPTHAMVHKLQRDEPGRIAVCEMNWMDNPWFPEELRKEKDSLYRTDPESADQVWGGNTRKRTKASIFMDKVVVQEFKPVTEGFPEQVWFGPYDGGDWGFSVDPTVLTRSWISPDKEDLYIEYESFGVGIELDDIPRVWRGELPGSRHMGWVPGVGDVPILCDSSRPETISHVSKSRTVNGVYIKGLPTRPAKKWSGSIEDGITYLRKFKRIVIHPRCTHMIKEAKEYSYKVDPLSGLITSQIVDAWNHGWDSVRYAHEKMITNKRSLSDVL